MYRMGYDLKASQGNRANHTLCSTSIIRPRLNSAKSYFFPKSGLSYVFVHNLMIYDHFLSTVWVFWTKKFKKEILDSILNWVLF